MNKAFEEVRRTQREKQEPLDLSVASIAMALTTLREMKDPLERSEYASNNPCAAMLLCRQIFLQDGIDPRIIYDIAREYAEERKIIEPCKALLENRDFWVRSIASYTFMAYWQSRLKTIFLENSRQENKHVCLSETDFFKQTLSTPRTPRENISVTRKLFGGCPLL